ncbi:hypothetical protein BDZ85DRAFT_51484 [Elsinoe ampelina]|uniref:Uncharacterized protein n=1 Tax=Elsinoe ampelina TaxID=302913 RepID=A0A6A6GLK4_9PEZI|nr:hypothetical protein BDZ85DRAFT_51484 [Elsinoe ampelina]
MDLKALLASSMLLAYVSASCQWPHDSFQQIWNAQVNVLTPECLDTSLIKVMADSYSQNVAEYRRLLATYEDQINERYGLALRNVVGERISSYFQRLGSQHWSCTWGDTGNTTIVCPRRDTIQYGNVTNWTLTNEVAFENSMAMDFGVPSDWLTRGDESFTIATGTGKPGCPPSGPCSIVWKNYPQTQEANVLRPDDVTGVLRASILQHEQVARFLRATDVELRQRIVDGDSQTQARNVTTAFALPHLMMQQALRSLKAVATEANTPSSNVNFLIAIMKVITLTTPAVSYEEASPSFLDIEQLLALTSMASQRNGVTFRAIANANDPWRIFSQYNTLLSQPPLSAFDELAIEILRVPERSRYIRFDVFDSDDLVYLDRFNRLW